MTLTRRLPMLLPALVAACADPDASLTCGAAGTPIHAIQGREAASPFRGQIHQIEGVATLSLSASDGSILGTFVQARRGSQDADRRTAEGLFILGRGLEPGHLYRISGTVTEFDDDERGLTALAKTVTRDCGAVKQPLPERLELPLDRHIEALEGMRVVIDGPLTVTGNHRLGSHAEIVVASGGRLYQPTEVAAPGKPARRLAEANLRRGLVLDDASLVIDSGAVSWWREPLSAATMLRAGDELGPVSGVIGQLDGYRLHLGAPVARATRAARPAPPPPPQAEELRVVTFNLLNFFNGDGRGGGFPTSRGAGSPAEFKRQGDKILSAMATVQPDLALLAELENDGSGPGSAVAELAQTLARESGRDYRAIAAPEGGLGGDAIAVGMIYDAGTLVPRGSPRTTRGYPFDDLNRPPLLAQFELRAGGGAFSAVAVHFKSKGCGDPDPANRDSGDGQGCWNSKRVEAARALADWIAALPGVDPGSTLVAGDFNAYAREDPLRELADRGYRLLSNRSRQDYSFVYRGRAGALDHAFAGTGLADRLARAEVWHINADESAWLDYRVAGKPPGDPLYRPSPFRSSDHDPIVLDFRLR